MHNTSPIWVLEWISISVWLAMSDLVRWVSSYDSDDDDDIGGNGDVQSAVSHEAERNCQDDDSDIV